MIRIHAVVGARPNLMKMAPLMEGMARHAELEPILIHTGQHYDERMSDLFFRQLGLPEPSHFLGVGSGTQAEQTARAMVGLEARALEDRPDLMLVVGDVNSTLAAALVAAKLGIRIAHVEAGLRSFDRRMPEEINRMLTDAVSDLLFTTERSAGQNLAAEGIPPEKVFFVGNVMIDTLNRHLPRARELGAAASWGLDEGAYALLTLHRPSNVDDPYVLGSLMEVVHDLAAELPVLFPAHPRTRKKLEEQGFHRAGDRDGRVRVVEPLGYLEFLSLMSSARFVLTDSGGVQEETTILGVPCLTLRENTERPATVTDGTNRVVGVEPARVRAAIEDVLRDDGVEPRRPELWDGQAASRIVEVLAREGRT